MIKDIYIVDIIEEVVASMKVVGLEKVFFTCGRAIDIQQFIITRGQSIAEKGNVFPLIALYLPIVEEIGSGNVIANVDKISISCVSENFSEIPLRYLETGVFKTILYPCYKEFMRRLAFHPNTSTQDPDAYEHKKVDQPGINPLTEGQQDYIDQIHILGTKIIFSKSKNCK